MMDRSPGGGGGRTARSDWRLRPRAVERIDGGQDLSARAPIIFRKIDFNPRKAATLDRPERTAPGERGESGRQPFAKGPAGNQAVHLIDEHASAVAAEFSDADVLAVRVGGLEALRNRDDAAAADAADVARAISSHDGHVLDAARAQRRNLPFEQRGRADAGETLRERSGHAAQASSSAGREDDGSHAPSDTAAARGRSRPPIWASFET